MMESHHGVTLHCGLVTNFEGKYILSRAVSGASGILGDCKMVL